MEDMMSQQAIWELEGELLQITMRCDKLRKKEQLSDEEKESLEDWEKRKAILEKKLREHRMRV